jgi:hypothetical protein
MALLDMSVEQGVWGIQHFTDHLFSRDSVGKSDSNCSSITPNWIWQWFPSSGTSQWVGAIHCEMLVDMHLRISG